MSDSEYAIWKPETGIVGLAEDIESLSESQIPGIKAVWSDQREQLSGTTQLTQFIEKLSREWAIETGVIENLYDIERGVTQTLVERGFQAELLTHGSTNKPHEYVLQLLRDQKDALDGVFDFVKSERQLSVSYIKELHAALLRCQNTTEGLDAFGDFVDIPLIKGDWKQHPNYPMRDGVTFTYCPPEHVASEMERLVDLYAQYSADEVPSEILASWLHHRFSQIHPFQDGNGRVARAIASLVLVKDGLFPLVITRDDKPSYIDALESADKDDLKPLVSLIAKSQISQFRKASAISESILIEEDVQSALDGLLKAADKVAKEKIEELHHVLDLSKTLERDLFQRLESIMPTISQALERVSDKVRVFMTDSNESTDYYYRSQIIENAKLNLGYYADTSVYRSWVCLNIAWSRRSKLVFTFHGIGRPFNGSLICSPFMEFRDTDEDGEARTSMIPVAEDGFVFFYNEDETKLLTRFKSWRESVINVAVKELTQNL